MQLKAKQLAVLMLSMFIFTLGLGIMIPVMGFFTKNMGASALELGLLMASMSLMQFLFAPVMGRLSDRIGRKPVMLVGLVGFSISFAIVGLSTQLWMLFVALVLCGVLSAGIWPAALAYIADISSYEERGKFMGYMGAASGLGIIAGPAISSILANWGLTLPFFASAALGLFTTVATLALLPESLQRDRSRGPEMKTPIMATIKSPLGMFFFLMLFVSFAISCIDTTYVYFISDRFGMSDLPAQMPALGWQLTLTGPNVLSILFTAMGFIAVASQLGVGTMIQKYGEEKTIMIGLVLMGAGMACVVLTAELVSLLLVTCLIGLGGNLLNPAINTLVSRRSPQDSQGAVMGVLGSFNSIGRVLGPSVGGFAYVVSMLLPYLGPAALALASTGVMRFVRRGNDRDIKAAANAE